MASLGAGVARHRAPSILPIAGFVGWYRRIGWQTLGIGLLIVLGWCRQTVTLVQLFETGRPKFNARATVGAAAEMAGDLCSLAFIGLAGAITVWGLLKGQAGNRAVLLIVLIPWLTLELSRLLNDQPPTAVALAYPLAATAIWWGKPHRDVFKVFAVLTIITAAGSMLLAVVKPELALITGNARGAKEGLLGGLLAGPYLHSNVLGIALALGLPFLFGIKGLALRLAGFAVVAGALAWTGSRSSQAAAAVAVVLYLVIKRLPGLTAKLTTAAAGAGLAAVVLLPLVVTDPESFTRRGRIWQALLELWGSQPLLGSGPDVFRVTPGLAARLGGDFQHAHNMMVHLLVTGGLATAIGCLALLVVAGRGALTLARAAFLAPAMFIVSLLFTSSLEASHINTTLAGSWFWLPLVLLARYGEGPAASVPMSDATVVLPRISAHDDSTAVLPRVTQAPDNGTAMATPASDDSTGLLPKVAQDSDDSTGSLPKVTQDPGDSTALLPKVTQDRKDGGAMRPRVTQDPDASVRPWVTHHRGDSTALLPKVTQDPDDNSAMRPRQSQDLTTAPQRGQG